MAGSPIFVVGVQRSGTTLLAAMLAAHSRLSCGPETHFFRRLAAVDEASLADERNWPQAATDFVSGITHIGATPGTTTTLLAKYRLDRDAIATFLAGRRPSIPAALEAVTAQYMAARGKVRWVEKTPDHLLYLEAIRRHFPDAPIVRILRDPRDVAVSLMKVPWGARSFLEGLLFWERMDAASRDFFLSDRHSYTLRFEDLVSDPAGELQKLCNFVGETFEPAMLDTSATGEEINARKAPWKEKVSKAADRSRAGAWREALSTREKQLSEAILGLRLRECGYPADCEFKGFARVCHGGLFEAGQEALEALAAEGFRFWPAHPGEAAAVEVWLGDPSVWLGTDPVVRMKRAAGWLTRLVRSQTVGPSLRWIPGPRDARSGPADALLRQWLGRRALPPPPAHAAPAPVPDTATR